ncbi:MAG: AMP-binding protein, partial [Gammaproteobacteria bacterium]|nr:AMP-binding protein [Gammaproteobacteria bacterium]
LAAAVDGSRSVLPLGPGDVWLDCLPLFHVGGASILLRAAAAGAAVVLHQRFAPEAVLADLAARAVTHLSLVPAMLARLLEATGAAPPGGLRHVLMGGAALPGPLAERALAAGWPLCASYGMTEAGSQVATRCGLRPGWRSGDVGSPLPGMEVAIVPEPGVAAATGVGRIRVRGPAVMGGYAAAGRPTGAGIEAGWFVTGDLGSLAPDGSLTVLGRADEVVVTGGENVHPAQVEAALSGCPGVVEAGVAALDDPVWGARLVAFFTGEAAPGAVLAWARAGLPPPWRPRAVHRLVALPRNAAGKLDRAALRARAERLAGASAPRPTSGNP